MRLNLGVLAGWDDLNSRRCDDCGLWLGRDRERCLIPSTGVLDLWLALENQNQRERGSGGPAGNAEPIGVFRRVEAQFKLQPRKLARSR